MLKLLKFILFIFILISLKLNFLNFNQPYNFLCLIMNFLFFISYTLVIGIRFINSPSYDIINYLKKNNSCERKKILTYLEDQKIIEERIKILIKDKLIVMQNDSILLTNNGVIFCKIFIFIKKFLGLKSEG